MRIGFLTSCLQEHTLEEIIVWAGAHGLTTLEVAAAPRKPHGVDPNLHVEHLDDVQAQALLDLAQQHGVAFSCLTYCDNMLHRDPEERELKSEHACRVLDAASRLGVGVVSFFIGRDETKTQRENLDELPEVYGPLLDYAAARNIRIAIENCPMPGWQFEGLPGNLAYSPDLWDELFRRLPYPNLGLNLDPSHLVWLGVDYLSAAREYGAHIFHTHAKDTEIFPARRARATILNAGEGGWWRYRLPGLGEIDWRAWVEALRAGGYDGVLSIEHEDPEWQGSEDKVKDGLLLAKKHLEAQL